jgi:transposase
MGSSTRLITEEIYNKGKLESMSQTNRAAIRLRAIVSAKEHGVNLVSLVYTLRAWIKSFAAEGLRGLDYKPGRGRKNKITEEHQLAINGWIEEDCNLTLNQIKLNEHFKIETSKSAVHREVKFKLYNAKTQAL